VEVARLERNLGLLATTGSVTPFIGLFGTVWGIMNAFSPIGMQRSTSIATVAPHIAEALIATAVGLFAAIPAVMAYNHFLSRVRALTNDLDDFRLEFLNVLERNFG
jgi:biopolymer transport protein TolQ